MRGIALPGQGQSIPSPLLRNTLGLLRVLQAPLYDTGNCVRILRRHQEAILPMDDALCLCAIDLCGRPYFSFDCNFTVEDIGGLDTELIREFFYAVSYAAGMNLHIKMISGINNHHMAEAMFKAFAKALDEATSSDLRVNGVLSTKGSL